MNFLAHLYLSGDDEEIIIGNFIADHVKGKSKLSFSEQVQKGIILHRFIDEFTDTHPVVELTKSRLRPQFHKYAPVISDIYFDHFLAKNWSEYSSVPLNTFANNFYELTKKYNSILPERTRKMLTYMISGNWLVSYSTLEGINKVLIGMSKRTTFESGMENAAKSLRADYSSYACEFKKFFPDLIRASGFKIKELI